MANNRPPRRWWTRPRTFIRHILLADDTPHSIALGTAIGTFIGLTPTGGVQMLLVMLVAFLCRPFFRFNQIAALLMVYISNPLTAVPIYWFSYKVGTLFFAETVTYKDFAHIFQYDGFAEWWHSLVTIARDVGAPLLVGSLIVATVCAVISYPATQVLVRLFRHPRPRRSLASDEPVLLSAERDASLTAAARQD
jgi:uncharacterized protein (DUF2062 family)